MFHRCVGVAVCRPEVSELSASSQSSSLDAYLAHHTSEDNASFEDLMAENEAKRRVKHAWLYEREKRQEQVTTGRPRGRVAV